MCGVHTGCRLFSTQCARVRRGSTNYAYMMFYKCTYGQIVSYRALRMLGSAIWSPCIISCTEYAWISHMVKLYHITCTAYAWISHIIRRVSRCCTLGNFVQAST
jgi:hypothetical protein